MKSDEYLYITPREGSNKMCSGMEVTMHYFWLTLLQPDYENKIQK